MKNSLSKALDEFTHGAAESRSAKQRQLGLDALQEVIVQYQLPVSGTAVAIPAFTSITIDFDVLFVDATEQRDSPYVEPNLTFGAVLDSPVMLSACVTEWTRPLNRASIINGAVVYIGVIGTGDAFSGNVHLSFQGYGALDEAIDLGT